MYIYIYIYMISGSSLINSAGEFLILWLITNLTVSVAPALPWKVIIHIKELLHPHCHHLGLCH